MADFDPHAFVAGEEFDPHAFVSDVEEGGPESFLHPDKFKPSPAHRKFKNTGPIAEVRQELDPRQIWNPDMGEAVAAPVLSAVDRLSLGGLGAGLRGAKALNEATGTTGPTVASRSLDAIEGYRGQHPVISQYSDIPGYLVGGPRAIAGGVERMLPEAVHPAAQAARAILGSGLTSAGVSGSESAMRGDEPLEVAKEAGRGYLGGTAVGVPMVAGANLVGATANAVLRSKGAQAREFLESRGQPLTAADTSDAAIGAASQRTDQAIKDAMAGYKQKVASGPYVEAINAIPQEMADKVVNVTPIYRDLALAANDPGNLQVADELNMLVKMLGDRPLMTQQELNGLRRSLAGIAGVGETTAGKQAPLRKAYESVKELVDRGPYAYANSKFAKGMDDYNQSLDMVGLRSSTNPDEPIKGNLRVASQRQGQNTVTAGADTERLDVDAFKAKHPELANVIDAPEILRRQGDLQFHVMPPHHGGLIERLAAPAGLGAYALASGFNHGTGGLASIPLALALQNLKPIAGRILYNPAQNAQIAAQMMLQGVPQLSAPGREVIQEGR